MGGVAVLRHRVAAAAADCKEKGSFGIDISVLTSQRHAAELFAKATFELRFTEFRQVPGLCAPLYRLHARTRLWAKGDRSAKRRRVTDPPYVPNVGTITPGPFTVW